MTGRNDRPNIVLINCDDLGYGDLGCYGSTANRTPALDRMASEGMRLTDFYMASPVCSPSRGAMMTGCYPPRIGFGDFARKGDSGPDDRGWVLFPAAPEGLSTDEITVASLLQRQGYATKLVGKWHCGDQAAFLPTRHGFDSYYGLPYSNDMGNQASQINRPPLPLMEDEEPIELQPDQRSLTIRYVEHSVRFMRENRDRPFFLYLAHMHVHLPHYPPMCFLEHSRNGAYGASVECIDWSVAVILHELKRLGLDEDTIVMFTSDNGSRAAEDGGSNDPLRGRKGTCWEGGQRVPCIVRWPGRVPAGSTCRELATAMDVLPTFAALAGAAAPDDRVIDGKDIRPLLLGEPGAASAYEALFYYRRRHLRAVRRGPWKLHVATGDRSEPELYNLDDDIGEQDNVAGSNPDVVARLDKLADACREDIGDAAVSAEGRNCRPIGRVVEPKPLAEHDENHPYIVAMYDLPQRG
ncbi:MAG: sulfatase [Planctomycetota bacterium]